MKITVVGAGAMGGSYGGLLALAGHEVSLIDAWQAHVDAINRDGLRLDGARGAQRVRLAASTGPQGSSADLAIVFVDANNTAPPPRPRARCSRPTAARSPSRTASATSRSCRRRSAPERVLGGSSMCSAATLGPGHVCLTHLGKTTIGETDGAARPRTEALAAALHGAGLETEVAPDVMAVIWEKFALNCCINALAATTGPARRRDGPPARARRLPGQDHRRGHGGDRGQGHPPADPGPAGQDQGAVPQEVQQALDAAARRGRAPHRDRCAERRAAARGRALGVATPYNEALVALLKGRELHQKRAIHEPDLDFDAWEARIARGEED